MEGEKTMGRPAATIALTPTTEGELRSLARSRSLPGGLVQRARIVLACAEGSANQDIAAQMDITTATVSKWRNRFARQGLMGLYDEPRSGAPRTISDEQVAQLIRQTLRTKPAKGTQWSCRSMAEDTGLSKSTIQRVWSTFGVQPHRQKHFKISTDPFFVEKVRDIVGLYLNPPHNALVLCVDEKSQVQALERTQRVLPMGLGYVEGVTHDYRRHGTTTLFAALDVATGEVLSQCKKRHRHQEFLSFLRHLDGNVPQDLDVHLIVDNYATHKHVRIRRWLACRSRYHVHYTPTYASWLNQVEIWFNIITQRAIRRGSFNSVRQLIQRINDFVEQHNKHCAPFTWTATAESILAKIKRLCQRISGTEH
jgi:putative transposase